MFDAYHPRLARMSLSMAFVFLLMAAPAVRAQQPAPQAPSGTISEQDTVSTTTWDAIFGTPPKASQVIAPAGAPYTAISIAGTWSGLLQFEGTYNGGVSWLMLQCTTSSGLGISFPGSVNTNGIFFCASPGAGSVRVRSAPGLNNPGAVWSGSAAVWINPVYQSAPSVSAGAFQ